MDCESYWELGQKFEWMFGAFQSLFGQPLAGGRSELRGLGSGGWGGWRGICAVNVNEVDVGQWQTPAEEPPLRRAGEGGGGRRSAPGKATATEK